MVHLKKKRQISKSLKGFNKKKQSHLHLNQSIKTTHPQKRNSCQSDNANRKIDIFHLLSLRTNTRRNINQSASQSMSTSTKLNTNLDTNQSMSPNTRESRNPRLSLGMRPSAKIRQKSA